MGSEEEINKIDLALPGKLNQEGTIENSQEIDKEEIVKVTPIPIPEKPKIKIIPLKDNRKKLGPITKGGGNKLTQAMKEREKRTGAVGPNKQKIPPLQPKKKEEIKKVEESKNIKDVKKNDDLLGVMGGDEIGKGEEKTVEAEVLVTSYVENEGVPPEWLD